MGTLHFLQVTLVPESYGDLREGGVPIPHGTVPFCHRRATSRDLSSWNAGQNSNSADKPAEGGCRPDSPLRGRGTGAAGALRARPLPPAGRLEVAACRSPAEEQPGTVYRYASRRANRVGTGNAEQAEVGLKSTRLCD